MSEQKSTQNGPVIGSSGDLKEIKKVFYLYLKIY